MTEKQFRNLKPGDILRGKSSGHGFIVTANYGDRATAVRTVDMTNPDEWDLIEGQSDPDNRGGDRKD